MSRLSILQLGSFEPHSEAVGCILERLHTSSSTSVCQLQAQLVSIVSDGPLYGLAAIPAAVVSFVSPQRYSVLISRPETETCTTELANTVYVG